MVAQNTNTNTTANSQPKKKRTSGGSLRKKGPSAYNKFMSEEMTRLRDIVGVEDGATRRKQATDAWNSKKHKGEQSSSP